jgi:hypothetical protein
VLYLKDNGKLVSSATVQCQQLQTPQVRYYETEHLIESGCNTLRNLQHKFRV